MLSVFHNPLSKGCVHVETMRQLIASLIIILCLFLSHFAAATDTVPAATVEEALYVLQELRNIPEANIPDDLLYRCSGLAIFPKVYKAGFIIGGNYGQGILVVRDSQTGQWSGPIFLTIGGGSIGYQIGVNVTELVLVIMNPKGINGFIQENLTLGGDLSVAAGPIGRKLEASTDIALNAEVYSYSISRGLFAGVALQGVYVQVDYKANERFYGKSLLPREILFQKAVASPPSSAQKLLDFLNLYYAKRPR
jgi:lipid-binding SYLF domain-containing protein